MPDATRNYRNRENEILFLDLRVKGIPFEKKFTQFSEENILEITNTYHNWQTSPPLEGCPQDGVVYENVPEFCFSATLADLTAKDFSLVPSKYITFVNRDENIDFDDKMKILQSEFSELLKAEAQSKTDLFAVFKELGYAIEL